MRFLHYEHGPPSEMNLLFFCLHHLTDNSNVANFFVLSIIDDPKRSGERCMIIDILDKSRGHVPPPWPALGGCDASFSYDKPKILTRSRAGIEVKL